MIVDIGARSRVRILAFALLAALIAGCGKPEPIRIGFIAGISGRVADLGIGGRNGALLAVEERNQAGGIGGRPVELLVRDDQQDKEQAARVFRELAGLKVEAVVGNMTSAMCAVSLPLANEAQLVMMSPTCTATAFSGIDDHFFRVISSTAVYAAKSAEYQAQAMQRRRIAVAIDMGNAVYTESWLKDFRESFEALGGEVLEPVGYRSSAEAPFADIAAQLAAAGADAVLFLSNSLDAAMLAQHVRAKNPKLPLIASEWASTERLVELGGSAVEGIMAGQFLDRDSQRPAFVAFRERFLRRFNQEPGFAGVAGYDAAKVALDALAARRSDETLKAALLRQRKFAGVDGEITFDANGDAFRETYLTTVEGGRFRTLRGR